MVTIISARVEDQALLLLSVPKIASGGANECRVEVLFDDSWKGYGKTGIFYRNKNKVYHVVMTDDTCLVPHEVLAEAGRVYFGVMGINGSIVRTTEVVALSVSQGAVTGVQAVEPLPDVYKQLLSAYGQTAQKTDVQAARLDNLLTGGTSDGSEVADIRVGFNGKTYGSAGAAVREQIQGATVRIGANGASLAKNHAFDYESIAVYESAGYLLADGTLNASETAYKCKYTQPVPCVEGDVFSYVGIGQFSAVSYIFFKDAAIVSTGQLYSADAAMPKYVTVPEGVDSVVFSSYAKTEGTVLLEIKHHAPALVAELQDIKQQLVEKTQLINGALSSVLAPDTLEELTPEWTPGYYYARDGRVVDYETVSMGRIKVRPGDTLTISGAVWASVVLYAFTDNVGQLLAGYPVESTVGEPTSETVTVVVPADAVYLYVNDITAAKTNAIAPTVSRVASYKPTARQDVLEGKVYVAVGDSYTEGDFSGWADENGLTYKDSPVIYDSALGMYKTYPWWVAKRNRMTVHNCGKCGSIVALDKDFLEGSAEITSRDPFALNRYKELPAHIDYMTFWFGINDAGHTNLGTISDTNNSTFYGAWNVVLPYLIEKYPLCKMGLIVTTGATAAYRQAVREIARKWGIPCLDLTGDANVPMLNGREASVGVCNEAVELRKAAFMLANGHPNIEAHEYISTVVENFLRSL